MTALERYNAHMEGELENADPLERLRFFLSLALKGQDWLDVEQFLDDLVLCDAKPYAYAYENRNVKGKWYLVWDKPEDGFNVVPLCARRKL